MEQKIREEARRMRQAEARGGDAGEDGDDAARAARTAAAGGAAAGRAIIDLDSLAFAQGGHFMSKKACVLPQGSYRCAQDRAFLFWQPQTWLQCVALASL